jgi:hypothetical protein
MEKLSDRRLRRVECVMVSKAADRSRVVSKVTSWVCLDVVIWLTRYRSDDSTE